MDAVLGNLWAAAEVVIVFGFVVMIHEFGHFLFAKLFGVKVESFNIGFGGKRLWSKRIGETEYSIRPWPLGGFVQLHGHFRPEEMEQLEGGKKDEEGGTKDAAAGAPDDQKKKRSISEAAYDDVHALREKPCIVKFLVFGAGVLFNFLSVVIVMTVFVMVGYDRVAPDVARLDAVKESSPIYAAGLRSFDHILDVNGKPVADWMDLILALRTMGYEKAAGRRAKLTVARQGSTSLTLTLPAQATSFTLFLETGPWRKAEAGTVLPGGPAQKAGIVKGDVIVAIDGHPVGSWEQMRQIISANAGKELTLTIQRGAERNDIRITPSEKTVGSKRIGQIGIGYPVEHVRSLNPFKAVAMGFREACDRLWEQATMLGGMFRRGNVREIGDSVGGPVAIIGMTFESAKMGFAYLIDFFCLLSVALVIFNLLPIPLLDGGHILQAAVEAIIRRPIPVKVLIFFYNVAFAILVLFVVLISFNDIRRMARQTFAGRAAKAKSEQTAPAKAPAKDAAPTTAPVFVKQPAR